MTTKEEFKKKVENIFREYNELIVYAKSVFLLDRPIDFSILLFISLVTTLIIHHSNTPFLSLLFILIAIYFFLQLVLLNYKNITKYIPKCNIKYDNSDLIGFIVERRFKINDSINEIKRSKEYNPNKLSGLFLVLGITTYLLSQYFSIYLLSVVSIILLPFILFAKRSDNNQGVKNIILVIGKPTFETCRIIFNQIYNYLFSIPVNSSGNLEDNESSTLEEELEEEEEEEEKEKDNESTLTSSERKQLDPFFVSPYHEDLICLLKKENDHNEQEVAISRKYRGFDFSNFDDGEYSANFIFKNGLSRSISLKRIQIKKEVDQIKPWFVDLSASVVSLSFNAYDKPVCNSRLTGIIELEGSGEGEIIIDTTTNSKGQYSALLPKCKVNVNVKGTVGGKPVEINENYTIEESRPVSSIIEAKTIRPKSFNKSINCTNYTINVSGKKAVYLCDISASMAQSVGGIPQIDKLKSTLKKKIDENKISISFVSWNKKTFFSLGNEWLNSETKSRNKIRLINWVDQLIPYGGNDMQQAILSTIKNFSEADEFIILCDGDISPFDLDSWSKFYNQNSKYIFSFVGIGSSSDEAMKQMAQISNGQYSRVD